MQVAFASLGMATPAGSLLDGSTRAHGGAGCGSYCGANDDGGGDGDECVEARRAGVTQWRCGCLRDGGDLVGAVSLIGIERMGREDVLQAGLDVSLLRLHRRRK